MKNKSDWFRSIVTVAAVVMVSAALGAPSINPRHLIHLAGSQLITSGNTLCGEVRGKWVPGRLVKHLFFPAQNELKELELQRRSARNPSAKKKLAKQIQKFKAAMQNAANTCIKARGGSGSPSGQPTPPGVQPTAIPTGTPTISPTPNSGNLVTESFENHCVCPSNPEEAVDANYFSSCTFPSSTIISFTSISENLKWTSYQMNPIPESFFRHSSCYFDHGGARNVTSSSVYERRDTAFPLPGLIFGMPSLIGPPMDDYVHYDYQRAAWDIRTDPTGATPNFRQSLDSLQGQRRTSNGVVLVSDGPNTVNGSDALAPEFDLFLDRTRIYLQAFGCWGGDVVSQMSLAKVNARLTTVQIHCIIPERECTFGRNCISEYDGYSYMIESNDLL